MVFGEIIEPSTRALIDDELEEYPEYTKPELKWDGDVSVPANLHNLIFIEGNKIIKLFNQMVLNANSLYCKLQSGDIQVYKISDDTFVVLFVKKELATGEIIEEFLNWIKTAKNVFALISQTLSSFQAINIKERPETLIRVLTTNNSDSFIYKKLESPNLVTGLGADVLSYSIHNSLKATLFVIYMDNSPMDSVNVTPITELLKSLNITVKNPTTNLNPIESNLYL